MTLTTYLVNNCRDLRTDYTLHAAIQAATEHTPRRALWRRDHHNQITTDTRLEPIPPGWRVTGHRTQPEPLLGATVWVEAWLNPTVTRNRKRHALPAAEHPAWGERQLRKAGLEPLGRVRAIGTRTITGSRAGTGRLTLAAALFVAHAQVADEQALNAALRAGVGPGKAFGLGLLTIRSATVR